MIRGILFLLIGATSYIGVAAYPLLLIGAAAYVGVIAYLVLSDTDRGKAMGIK